MNEYIAFYRDKRMEVVAATSLAARDAAVAAWRPRRPHEVHVVLVRLNGQDISHSPAEF